VHYDLAWRLCKDNCINWAGSQMEHTIGASSSATLSEARKTPCMPKAQFLAALHFCFSMLKRKLVSVNCHSYNT
jgi:hypothetical protein